MEESSSNTSCLALRVFVVVIMLSAIVSCSSPEEPDRKAAAIRLLWQHSLDEDKEHNSASHLQFAPGGELVFCDSFGPTPRWLAAIDASHGNVTAHYDNICAWRIRRNPSSLLVINNDGNASVYDLPKLNKIHFLEYPVNSVNVAQIDSWYANDDTFYGINVREEIVRLAPNAESAEVLYDTERLHLFEKSKTSRIDRTRLIYNDSTSLYVLIHKRFYKLSLSKPYDMEQLGDRSTECDGESMITCLQDPLRVVFVTKDGIRQLDLNTGNSRIIAPKWRYDSRVTSQGLVVGTKRTIREERQFIHIGHIGNGKSLSIPWKDALITDISISPSEQSFAVTSEENDVSLWIIDRGTWHGD